MTTKLEDRAARLLDDSTVSGGDRWHMDAEKWCTDYAAERAKGERADGNNQDRAIEFLTVVLRIAAYPREVETLTKLIIEAEARGAAREREAIHKAACARVDALLADYRSTDIRRPATRDILWAKVQEATEQSNAIAARAERGTEHG